jgi:hypothetical protein
MEILHELLYVSGSMFHDSMFVILVAWTVAM